MKFSARKGFKALVILAAGVAVAASLAGCSKAINRSNLRLEPDAELTDLFHQKTGLDYYLVVFGYNVDSGAIKVVNVNPKTLTPGYFRGLYSDNLSSLKYSKTVTDCIVVGYNERNDNKNKVRFSACEGTEYDFDGTLFREKGDHKDFGLPVIKALNSAVSSSCSVSDSKINAWHMGGCVNNLAEGEGMAVGVDKFIGSFAGGKMTGKGEYFWRNHDHYEGDFEDDKITGVGTYQFANGDSYRGAVVANVRTGQGTYTRRSGGVESGFFLNNRLLSEDEYIEYRSNLDPVFAKEYKIEMYQKAYDSAASSAEFAAFISRYEKSDYQSLLPTARIKLREAQKRESAEAKARALAKYRDDYSGADTSHGYALFIDKYKGNDPEGLVAKAKTAKAAALKREKSEYDSVISRSFAPNYKVKVTYKTSPGKAIALLPKVIAAAKVRDPAGFFNPYWVPRFHAFAAYDNKGVVVGEWYTEYYDGWSQWMKYLKSEMDRLGVVDWQVQALGDSVRPRSNYAAPSPAGSSASSAASQSSGKTFVCRFYCDTGESSFSKTNASFGRIEAEVKASSRDDAVSRMYGGGLGTKACKRMGADSINEVPYCWEK